MTAVEDHAKLRQTARLMIALAALVFMGGVLVIVLGKPMTGGFVMMAGAAAMLVGGTMLNRTRPVSDDDPADEREEF